MNICLFTDSFLPRVGGMELVVHHLATALEDLGENVTVVAKRVRATGHFSHNYRIVNYGYDFPLSGRSGTDLCLAFLTLRREHKKTAYDVVHCHSVSYAGSRAVFSKQLLKFPLVMTPHGEDVQRVPEINYGLRLKKRWDRIIRSNLKRADAITAISDSIKNEIDFLPQTKIFMIPNGIELDKFDTKKSKFLHKELKIDKDIKIVLSVGRNHIKKGYKYGIHAFSRLQQRDQAKDLVYVIIGRDTDKLKSLVSELSLNDRIYLVPQKDRASLLKCYQSAWCFFSPSIIEGFSLVSIEAMASGLPLIVTDVPGNIDVVRDNQCGIVVNNKDIESMAEGILELYLNKELYRKTLQKGLERSKRYDWENVAKEYLEVYKSAINNYYRSRQ